MGDSRITIQGLILKKAPNNMELAHFYRKVTLQMKAFEELKLFHILRHLNQIADHEANLGVSLSKGALSLNGTINYVPIP